MGLDSDAFDDIFADHTVETHASARARGKFQPKAKRGPVRKGLIASSVPPLQPVQTGDFAEKESNVAVQIEKLSEPYNQSCLESTNSLEHAAYKECADQTVGDDRCLESVHPLEHAANKESINCAVENSLQTSLDPDPFDDIFSDNPVKSNRGKFQPKPKHGPKKRESTVPTFSSSQAVETVDSVTNESRAAIEIEKSSESLNDLEHAANKGSVDHSVGSIPEADVPITDWGSCFEKSVGENADIFLGLESLDDFLPQSATDMENSNPLPERPAIPATQDVKDGLGSPVLSRATESACTSNIADDPECPELLPNQDPLARGQRIVSVNDGGCHMHDGRLESEQMESSSCLENLDMPDITITSGRRTGKFQPKPKFRKERSEASAPNTDGLESVISEINEPLDPLEFDSVDKGPESAFPPDDVFDFSSLGFDDSIPPELTTAQPANEQPTNFTEMSQAEHATHEEHTEAVGEMRDRNGTRRGKACKGRKFSAPDVSANQLNSSTSSRDNGPGRSLRPRQKRTNGRQLVDEPEDEEPDEEFSADRPSESGLDEDNDEDNDEDFQEENEAQVKKQRRNTKKPVGDKQKPVRRRKRGDEASNQATAKAPKKFSHSTRQKRRKVDKVLLETPEDEIEFQKVPLRDLILLAEYRERIAKKEAAISEANLNSQRVNTTSTHCNEDEVFPPEQEEDVDDGEATAQEASSFFNYQTFMDKTPSSRWSKQDTELFYEAVQQFGTDLSMIQQLFPGRTRNQIKLKYKKEERQQPLRLREALTNRANDHSHFQQVIEHLRQIAAENKQNSGTDEPIDLADDEELIPETTEEAVKSEQQMEQEVVEEMEKESSVHGPVKTYDSEDDDGEVDWSQY